MFSMFSSRNYDHELLDAAKNGDLEAGKQLILEGADINARETRLVQALTFLNYTPLIYAARFGHEDFVQWILTEAKLQKEVITAAQTRYHNRNTALHWAARCGHLKIVKALLKANLDCLLIQEDEFGYTPLHWAAFEGHLDVVSLILAYAENLDSTNLLMVKAKDGRTAFQIAFDKNHFNIVNCFWDYIDTFDNTVALENALHHLQQKKSTSRSTMGLLFGNLSTVNRDFLDAAMLGDLEKLRQAIRDQADINVRDIGEVFGNYTGLIYASKYGHDEIVAELLECHADTSAQTYFNTRNTALHWAARNGHIDAVKLLVKKDPAPLTIHEDEFGYTPLHWAAMNGHLTICLYFIHTVDVHLLTADANDNNSTPIDVAIANGRLEVAKILLKELASAEEIPAEFIMRLKNSLNFAKSLAKLDPSSIDIKKIETNWQKANAQEYLIMHDLSTVNLSSEMFQHFLKGGHLVIQDGGYFYKKWFAECPNKTNRQHASSHHSLHDQQSVRGSFFKECLWGDIIIDEKLCTWLQLESHPVGAKHLAGHMGAFCLYKLTGHNQGPYGSSPHTDRAYMQAYVATEENEASPDVLRMKK